MSEKEIINYFKEVINWYRENAPDRVYALNNKDIETIQGLLDLYQKEKEKNKKYQGIENGTTIIYKSKAKYVREDRITRYYIDKYKIREKIKEIKKDENPSISSFQEYAQEYAINKLQELLGE